MIKLLEGIFYPGERGILFLIPLGIILVSIVIGSTVDANITEGVNNLFMELANSISE